jgi:hypothetical protein
MRAENVSDEGRLADLIAYRRPGQWQVTPSTVPIFL